MGSSLSSEFFFSLFSLFLLTIFLFFCFFTQEPKKNVQPQPGPGADYDMLMKMLLIGDNGLTQISFSPSLSRD